MQNLGSWLSILSGALMLTGTTILRRRLGFAQTPLNLRKGMFLIGVAMIIGPLPWALGIASDAVRIGASVLSILASLTGFALIVQLIWLSAQRLDA
jgi:hypothetical protein